MVHPADLTKSARFRATPRVLRTPAGERWVIQAEVESTGLTNVVVTASAASWGSTEAQRKDNLPAGRSQFEFEIPPLRNRESLRVRLQCTAGEQVYPEVAIDTPRHWTVYLTQHTHTDIGYTRPQTEILPESLRFLDDALDFCDATDAYPADARFRWTCETFWAVRDFLQTRPPDQIERLRRRVAEGRVEVAGMLLNLSEIATESSLWASLQSLRLAREEAGLPVVTAMQNDVNGAAWCLPDYFAGIGIRYLSMGINKTRSILPFDQPTAFWWEAPSGRRVLAFRADHYHLGNFWGIHTGEARRFGSELGKYLCSLEDRQYPWDRIGVQFSGYHTDNSPPSTVACDLVRRWNEEHVWPRLRLSVAREFLEYVEREHGPQLAVHRQAWPDWWTDGFGSAARETAASRETHATVRVSEALLAMAAMAGRPIPEEIRQRVAAVHESLMFYDEHTFGAAESISDPLAENAQVQWNEKSAYVWSAVKEAHLLEENAFGLLRAHLPRAEVPGVVVVNTLNWPRSGVAEVFVDHQILNPDREFRIVDVARGEVVPAQMLSRRSEGSYWALWVKDVPPMGYRFLRVEAGDGRRTAEAKATESATIENAHYALALDANRGGIVRLVDKATGEDLVDGGAPWVLGALVYERLTEGRDFVADRFRREAWREVRVEPGVDGPLWRSVVLKGRLDGCAEKEGARLEVRLFQADKRIEFHYAVRKLPVTAGEAVYVVFPFQPATGQLAYEAQGGMVRPGVDQLPGSSSDWQTVQSVLAVRHDRGQILWGSVGAPLVQLGEINLGKWQPVTRVARPHVYSWVMNNYWFTNFRVSQEGDFRWSYHLTSTSDTGAATATRFGWSSWIPLACRVLPAAKSARADVPASRSLLGIDVPGVLMVDARPASGGGVLVHLREVDGKGVVLDLSNVRSDLEITKAAEVSALEEMIEDDIGSLELKPYDVRFVRLQFGGAGE